MLNPEDAHEAFSKNGGNITRVGKGLTAACAEKSDVLGEGQAHLGRVREVKSCADRGFGAAQARSNLLWNGRLVVGMGILPVLNRQPVPRSALDGPTDEIEPSSCSSQRPAFRARLRHGNGKESCNCAALFDQLLPVYFNGPIDDERATPIIKPITAAMATIASPYGFLSISLILSRLLVEILLVGTGCD